MKKGDIVRCKLPFKVEVVNSEVMTISIRTTEKGSEIKDYIILPLYIGHLNFNFPQYDRCLPGSYLPINHSDYYRETGTGEFLYNGESYRISFDPNFMYTGSYWLIPIGGQNLIHKTAALRSDKLREEAIQNFIGAQLDGSLIEGVILEFVIRDKMSNQLKSIINGPEVSTTPGSSVVFAYLQDPVTLVEYQFPIKYLTKKP